MSGALRDATSSVLYKYLTFGLRNPNDYNFVDTLRAFRDKRLLAIKENKEHLEKFRLDLNNLAIEQTTDEWTVEPIKLWCSETITKWNVIEFLSNLAGTIFFFNDITLLTKIDGNELPWETCRPNAFLAHLITIIRFFTVSESIPVVSLCT